LAISGVVSDGACDADGFAVTILATRPEPAELLDELRAAGGAVGYTQGSVGDLADHARFLDEAENAFGRLDVLVNNAGVAPTVRADLLEATPESFDRLNGTNLRGPHFLTQEFARRVIARRGSGSLDKPLATVINVSSISAETVSVDRGDYCL
jgi:NAD(P)-dependent dehydrogenase (short-subunit alcohol dehydrogenase family)